MPRPRALFLPEAEQELSEALAWYAERSMGAAEAFLQEVEHASALVAESPDVWPVFEGELRRYVLRRFPFDVVYRKEDARVVVLAVAHHKREPGYWHGRSAG